MHTALDTEHFRFKRRFAFALVMLAAVSGAYAFLADHNVRPTSQEFTGIVTALAKSDVLANREYDMFLKVDTITGDSPDLKHRNEITVDSFTFGESRASNAGRPTMDGFIVMMPVSVASPKLFLYGAGNTRIPRVVLSVKMRGANQDFLKWTLTDAQISSFKTVGNTHGDGVLDQVTFTFGKIETEFRQTLPDGSVSDSASKAGWDQRTNKAS